MKMSRVMRVALVIILLVVPVLEYAATQTDDPRDNEAIQHLREILDILLGGDEE